MSCFFLLWKLLEAGPYLTSSRVLMPTLGNSLNPPLPGTLQNPPQLPSRRQPCFTPHLPPGLQDVAQLEGGGLAGAWVPLGTGLC